MPWITLQNKIIQRDIRCIRTCTCCGKEFDKNEYVTLNVFSRFMSSRKICFECSYWLTQLETPIRPIEIVNHELWVHDEVPYFFKSAAPLSKFMYTHTGLRRIEYPTRIGLIPKRFWTDFPNTGCFINKDLYYKIEAYRRGDCRAIGCYDRYHCLWYNPAKQEPKGPWNEVPPEHIIGNEKCPSFINTDYLKI